MFKKFTDKAKLVNAFKVANISLTIKMKDTTHKRYPSILEIRENDAFMQYVFMIPPGMNPEDFIKKEYVFQQVFGKNYELVGDGLKYSLKIHKKELEKFLPYNYEELRPLLKGGLPILAGMDIQGKYHWYDMVVHPHLLIVGETGSGKSVMLRLILTTLILMFETGLDLYLADMKLGEFHLFRHCKSVKAVMSKKTELNMCLLFIKKELRVRGELIDAHEVAHIDDYNKIEGVKKKNYILLCIDEVYILKKETKSMEILEEISCIGRALGVFIILSMQRADAKLLDGQLKNNLTTRYAFRHSDKINSDITLGKGSKENASKISMKDKGKFYFKSESILLLQAPFLSMEDAKELLEPYKVRPHINVDAEIINEEHEQYDELEEISEINESDFEPLPTIEEEEDEPT